MWFYCGKLGHFQKKCRHYKKEKGGPESVELRKIFDNKSTSAIVASDEEMLLISQQNEVNPASDESSWVVDSDASFHLTLKRECFSSYTLRDYDYVKMEN